MPLEALRQLTIVVIIVLCIIILQGLFTLYYQTKEWRFLSLMLIPASFCVTYIWIGITAPTMEASRDVVRSIIILSSFNAIHVIFTYLGKLRKMNKRKSDVVMPK